MTTKNSQISGLVITRRPGQTIVVNRGELIIQVLKVKSNRVMIRIEGSRDISLLRGEVFNAISKPLPPCEKKE